MSGICWYQWYTLREGTGQEVGKIPQQQIMKCIMKQRIRNFNGGVGGGRDVVGSECKQEVGRSMGGWMEFLECSCLMGVKPCKENPSRP